MQQQNVIFFPFFFPVTIKVISSLHTHLNLSARIPRLEWNADNFIQITVSRAVGGFALRERSKLATKTIFYKV